MGYASGSLPMSFNAEKLEKLLRHAKVTQQSIQTVSTWILDRRAFLNDIVEVWVRLLKESEASHQIVYLYIANDTMQVGVRKYGKHIAELFEARLLEVVTFVMTEGDEKVKRCMIKIIGIWKERHTVNVALLDVLQNVCAGRPAVPETAAVEQVSEDEQVRTAQETLLQEMDTDAGDQVALRDMTEVIESEATATMTQRLQELVTATISADLLSDRMFQLETCLSAFHHAIEAFNSAEEREGKSGGDIEWELLDQQVFEVDVDRSREHVQLYRTHLESQNGKRDELLQHLESLKLYDPFQEPMFHTSKLLRDQQAESLVRLHGVCLRAEIIDSKREAERQAMHKSRPPLAPPSSASSMIDGSYRPSSSSTPRSEYYRSSEPLAEPSSSFPHTQPQRSPVHRRYSSIDSRDARRSDGGYDDYRGRDDGYSKRPRLTHSQSLDDSRRDRPSRWDQSPRGERFQDAGRGNGYGGYNNSNDAAPYQDYRAPSPRYDNHGSHSSRWDNDGRRDSHRRQW